MIAVLIDLINVLIDVLIDILMHVRVSVCACACVSPQPVMKADVRDGWPTLSDVITDLPEL